MRACCKPRLQVSLNFSEPTERTYFFLNEEITAFLLCSYIFECC